MNTPDIEWEKKIREKLSVAGSDGFAIDADIDGVIEIVTQTLTSRDTYWKEMVIEKYGSYTCPCGCKETLEEAITNEDNLK